MRAAVPVAVVLLLAALVALVVVTRDDDDAYRVRAIFDNAGFVIPGEDVKVAGVKVGSISDVEVTPDFKAAVVLQIDDPAYQDFRADASCIVRPQSLIGERFVECDPTRTRGVGAEPAGPLRQIEDGPGRGRVPAAGREHVQDGRPRPAQRHHARARAPAPVDHPQRARRRPRRPGRRPQRGHPARQPGAQGGRRGPQAAGAPERRAGTARRRLRHDHGPARPRARARGIVDREHGRGRRRHGGAARRARGRHPEAAGLPGRAEADDGAARRARRRDDAGLHRSRRGRPRHQPLPARARAVLAGRDPRLRHARRRRRRRHAGDPHRHPGAAGHAEVRGQDEAGREAAEERADVVQGQRRAGAAARLRLLLGDRGERLRLVRPLPARGPDRQPVLDVRGRAHDRLLGQLPPRDVEQRERGRDRAAARPGAGLDLARAPGPRRGRLRRRPSRSSRRGPPPSASSRARPPPRRPRTAASARRSRRPSRCSTTCSGARSDEGRPPDRGQPGADRRGDRAGRARRRVPRLQREPGAAVRPHLQPGRRAAERRQPRARQRGPDRRHARRLDRPDQRRAAGGRAEHRAALAQARALGRPAAGGLDADRPAALRARPEVPADRARDVGRGLRGRRHDPAPQRHSRRRSSSTSS